MKPIGKYTIVREIGRGGMGVVYEAFDSALERPVAIKLLLGERDADRFQREARAAAQVNHPNCLILFDSGSHDGHPFLVMELVTGMSAAQLVARRGKLTWKNATRLVAAAARGLGAVHVLGLVHRDVKPSNLLITKAGVLKVADFGLATSATKNSRSLTGEAVVGTPDYMSPEQCMAEMVDARTDVYALGAAYFTFLTGKPPFSGEHNLQVMFAHCNNPIPDPRQCASGIPDGCAAVVFKAMAKNPADRYQTMAEMLAALVAVLKAEGKEAPPDPTGEHHPLDLPPDDEPPAPSKTPEPGDPSAQVQQPKPSRRKLLFALPAVAAVVAAGGYAVVKGLKGQDQREQAKESPGEPPKPPEAPKQPQPKPTEPPLREQTIPVIAAPMAVAISRDRRLLAVAMSDFNKGGGVQLFELHPGGFEEKWRKWLDTNCWGVAFSPTEPWLAVAKRNPDLVEVWDYSSEPIKKVAFPDTGNLESPRALAFSANGKRFVAGTRAGASTSQVMARMWQTAGQRRALDFTVPKKRVGSVRCVGFSPDSEILLASDDGPEPACVAWSPSKVGNDPPWIAPVVGGGWVSGVFAANANVFAVAGKTSVQCFSYPTFAPVGKTITTSEPEMIAISPNGKLLALKLSSRVELHDVATGERQHKYDAPSASWALTFTPDGKNLISGHTDKVVRVWVVPGNL